MNYEQKLALSSINKAVVVLVLVNSPMSLRVNRIRSHITTFFHRQRSKKMKIISANTVPKWTGVIVLEIFRTHKCIQTIR